jgi:hypothetical protein
MLRRQEESGKKEEKLRKGRIKNERWKEKYKRKKKESWKMRYPKAAAYEIQVHAICV